MLRISKLADYGTVIMVYLARNPEDTHNAKDVAEHCHLGTPTVSKLLKLLASAKLLNSQRGAKGGYSLVVDSKEISVAQIIEAVDGNSGLTECSDDHSSCFLEPVCNVTGNWRLISHAIYTALDSVKLSDLAKPVIKRSVINVNDIKNISASTLKKEVGND